MDEFERARQRYRKNQERKARLGIVYGPLLEEPVVPKKVEALPVQTPEKKVSPHGHFTVHLRVQDVDEVFTFTVQSMAGNFPGRLARDTIEPKLKQMLASFGRVM